MNKDEALKMAIEAMETAEIQSEYDGLSNLIFKAINACKEALEQPAQEPVAWTDKHNLFLEFDKELLCNNGVCKDHEVIPLYTHPAPSWQGLSDDEIREIDDVTLGAEYFEEQATEFARAIEAKVKEKNT